MDRDRFEKTTKCLNICRPCHEGSPQTIFDLAVAATVTVRAVGARAMGVAARRHLLAVARSFAGAAVATGSRLRVRVFARAVVCSAVMRAAKFGGTSRSRHCFRGLSTSIGERKNRKSDNE